MDLSQDCFVAALQAAITREARSAFGLEERLDSYAWCYVELRGIEPLTPSMPWKCSAN